MAKTFRRLRVTLAKRGKATQEWHYDEPKRVSMGYRLGNDLWLPIAGVDADFELIARQGKAIGLRVPLGVRGEIAKPKGSADIAAWRTSAYAKPHGDAHVLLLDEGTRVAFDLGEHRLVAWVETLPLAEKDHRLAAQLAALWSGVPRLYVAMLVASVLFHGLVLYSLRRLPSLDRIMPSTVEDHFQRITIKDVGQVDPELQRRLQEAESMGIKVGERVARPAQPVDATGFIQAVVAPTKNAASSFGSLFTANAFTKDLNQALAGKSFGDVVKTQMQEAAKNPFAGGIPGGTGTGGLFTASLPTQGGAPTAGALSHQASSPAPAPRAAATAEAAPSGSLDKGAVSRVFAARSAELEDCYQGLLARTPGVSGKITVTFDVTPSGQPGNVRAENATPSDAQFQRCIIGRVAAWTFPKPAGGTVSFRFPLIFSPAASGR